MTVLETWVKARLAILDIPGLRSIPANAVLIARLKAMITPPMPIITVDVWGTPAPEMFESPLWANPNVVRMPVLNWSNGDGDGRPGWQRADDVLPIIGYAREQHEKAHPGVPFRWAMNLWRLGGDGIGIPGCSLFLDPNDRMENGWNGPWTDYGRGLFRPVMRDFCERMAAQCKVYGIPEPLAFDPDFELECPGPVAAPPGVDIWAAKNQWHEWIMADARAKTVKVDGHRTYPEIIESVRDWDGNRVADENLYDFAAGSYKREFIGKAMFWHMIVDYGLHDVGYSEIKRVWPKCLCGNWGVYGATRAHMVHNQRFTESPIDVGPGLWADVQYPARYGLFVTDTLDRPVGQGYNSWYEQFHRFKLIVTGDPDFIARTVHLDDFNYCLAGAKEANPSKVGFSMSWRGDGIWYGPGVVGIDGERGTDNSYLFPASMKGARIDYNAHPELVQAMFQKFRQYGARVVNIFAQDPARAGYDAMAAVLAKAV